MNTVQKLEMLVEQGYGPHLLYEDIPKRWVCRVGGATEKDFSIVRDGKTIKKAVTRVFDVMHMRLIDCADLKLIDPNEDY